MKSNRRHLNQGMYPGSWGGLTQVHGTVRASVDFVALYNGGRRRKTRKASFPSSERTHQTQETEKDLGICIMYYEE